MSGSILKRFFALGSALGLLGATAANAVEVTPLSGAATSVVILAEGQRQTNLRKTTTAVNVLGIDGDRRQRPHH